MEKEIVQVSNY